jgi:hypothetical protein
MWSTQHDRPPKASDDPVIQELIIKTMAMNLRKTARSGALA